jgi:hypothetical protein
LQTAYRTAASPTLGNDTNALPVQTRVAREKMCANRYITISSVANAYEIVRREPGSVRDLRQDFREVTAGARRLTVQDAESTAASGVSENGRKL